MFSFCVCLRACVCVRVSFCTLGHQCVRAYVHMRRRTRMSDLGPSIICFSHTTLLRPILSQSWAETSELLGRISTSELDPQPSHFTNQKIVFLLVKTALVGPCTLLQYPTSHALLTSPTPCQREFVCETCIGTAQVDSRWLHP